MKARDLHPWRVAPDEALRIQRRLASQVSFTPPDLPRLELVAGVDLSPPDAQGRVRGAVVVVRLPGFDVEEVKTAEATPPLPYIPGLLSFRESPAILAALERLKSTPQVVLVDGHGLAHPRRFGIACHLGLLLDAPTVGCAKSVLRGRYGDLGGERGARAPLVDRGETVGAAVRTRAGVSPIFVSVGHRADLETAIQWTLASCSRYRMPEPTRLAHLAAAGSIPERDPAEGVRQAGF